MIRYVKNRREPGHIWGTKKCAWCRVDKRVAEARGQKRCAVREQRRQQGLPI